MVYPELSYKIIGSIFEVFNNLGYGYQEKYYQKAIAKELKRLEIPFKEQAPFEINFKGEIIGKYFLDFLVEDIDDLKSKLFDDSIYFSPIVGDKGSIGVTVETFNTDYLDINAGNAAINKLILKTYKTVKVGGYAVKMIIPELLAIMKIELGRNKDIEDGLSLITSKTLNKEVYLKLVNGLKKYLKDYESLISYVDIL